MGGGVVVAIPSLDFCSEAPDSNDFGIIEDRYESVLSINTKQISIALHLPLQWHSNDVIVVKKAGFYRVWMKIGQTSIFHQHPRSMQF